MLHISDNVVGLAKQAKFVPAGSGECIPPIANMNPALPLRME
jgi:hypothetical protein